MSKRAVITGMGLVSPLGNHIDSFWYALKNKKHGIVPISEISTEGFPVTLGAEVKSIQDLILLESERAIYSRMSSFAVSAARNAIQDAGLSLEDENRTDVLIGSAIGNLRITEEGLINNPECGMRFTRGIFDPLTGMKHLSSTAAGAVAFAIKADGLVMTVTDSCPSALVAMGMAYERIKYGISNSVIVGGVDTPLNYTVMNAFCETNSLSTSTNPDLAVLPFGKYRDGYVLGEGAGVIYVEELQNAKRRNARIYSEIVGFSSKMENRDPGMNPDRSGKLWGKNILQAIKDSKIKNIDSINAHAPGDRIIDQIEARAMRYAMNDAIPVVSIKGNVGTAFAAAGAFQIIASVLSLESGFLPATLSGVPDKKLGINIQMETEKTDPISILINSRGYGSINSALVLRKI